MAGSRFCSEEHMQVYRTRMESSFVERLNHTRAKPAKAAVAAAKEVAANPLMAQALELRWDQPEVNTALKPPLSLQGWVKPLVVRRRSFEYPAAASIPHRVDRWRAEWSEVFTAPDTTVAFGLPVINAAPWQPMEVKLKRDLGRARRIHNSPPAELRPYWPLPGLAPESGNLFPESIFVSLDLVLTATGSRN
jgi:hypothetical protein